MVVSDAAFLKTLRHPFGGVSVAVGLMHAICLEKLLIFCDDAFRIKRAEVFAQRMDYDQVAIFVADASGHRVAATAARWVRRTEILVLAELGWALANASVNAAHHHVARNEVRNIVAE